MRILDRYILREILGYALLGLGVFVFILIIPELVRLSELLAQENIGWVQVAKLFLSVLPGKLTWAIPLSVLTGLLMAVSRLAADSEIIALHAAGVGRGRLLRPLLLFAAMGCGLTLAATVWGIPLGARTVASLRAELAQGQLAYEVKPRVFDERFPQRILYVQDTEEGGARWKGVFLADLTDPTDFKLTLAESAVVVPDAERRSLLLHLFNGTTHAYLQAEPERYSISTFAESTLAMPLPSSHPGLQAPRSAGLSLSELWRHSQQGPRWRSLRADFHRRLALPAACLVFGLVALPLGLMTQRSGRAVGFVLALALALGYYFVFLLGDRLGRQGDLSPGAGVWLANNLLLLLGLFSLAPVPRWLRTPRWLARLWAARWGFRSAAASGSNRGASLQPSPPRDGQPAIGRRLPRTLDLYVLRGVLFYFLLLLAALVAVFALFTVLEMVDDIAARDVSWAVVARFVWYLLPQALYWMSPLALLLAVLVELALLSKRNELVAIMGAGISLYRVTVPVLLLGLGLSGLLFALDHHYLPYANQQQEALRNTIKGRPPQTFFQSQQRWVFGHGPRIYHYAFFDPTRNVLVRPTVLGLEPGAFSIHRRIDARRAHWEPQLDTWVFERGWERNFQGERTLSYRAFDATTFRELSEPPSHFRKEVRKSEQMNWRELDAYIADLRRSGFDVTRLRVQWHKKFAYPLMAAVIVLLAFPFGLTMGVRGALTGLALGIALGLSYFVLANLFEALGNLALLPPALAAWGPSLAFAFAGLYLILRIDT
ncbi:MAG: LPS export ABC transporter permease LptF [Candidatus Acidoferrales bacterium]